MSVLYFIVILAFYINVDEFSFETPLIFSVLPRAELLFENNELPVKIRETNSIQIQPLVDYRLNQMPAV
jgi:hypothetical protein